MSSVLSSLLSLISFFTVLHILFLTLTLASLSSDEPTIEVYVARHIYGTYGDEPNSKCGSSPFLLARVRLWLAGKTSGKPSPVDFFYFFSQANKPSHASSSRLANSTDTSKRAFTERRLGSPTVNCAVPCRPASSQLTSTPIFPFTFLHLQMDITNWCNSGNSKEIIRLGRPNYDDQISSSLLCFTGSLAKLRWKLLWIKLRKEIKRKMLESRGPVKGAYNLCDYSKNFDQGLALEEPEYLSRSFSVRFADPSRIKFLKKTAG